VKERNFFYDTVLTKACPSGNLFKRCGCTCVSIVAGTVPTDCPLTTWEVKATGTPWDVITKVRVASTAITPPSVSVTAELYGLPCVNTALHPSDPKTTYELMALVGTGCGTYKEDTTYS